MPSELSVGQSSAANDKIGGVPTIHYFDFFSKGRGQVPRLMLIDAGAAYKDVRYGFDEFWNEHQAEFRKKGGLNPTGNLPVIELNGKNLTQTYAVLRHWSRQLDNAYDGDTKEEKYQVDRLCDIGIDYRTAFITAFFSPNSKEDYPKFQRDSRPNFLHGLERHLEESQWSGLGPFVIGHKFTYADMVIFQLLHDEDIGKGEQKELADYPRLKALYNGVMERPKVKAFFNSSNYKG